MDEQDRNPRSAAMPGRAAIQAANRCHAPYSHSPSGVALELNGAPFFSGSYAENAAFNPDAAAAAGALNL